MDINDLERRIIVLEEQARHERELTDWRFNDLSRQLQALERSRLRQIPLGSLGKMALAIALPLIVLLGTGDLRKVVMAIRLAMGG